MTSKRYNKTNFHKHTFCEFAEVELATISTIDWTYQSKSGSGYCFTEKGVYRISNHWGRVANCRWRLISNSSSKINNSLQRVGYAHWFDFYPNNETENLFYIEVNFDTKEVTFQHKNNPSYDGKAMLRNSSETAKVIRQIKEILESDAWAKYYCFEDIEKVRLNVIHTLISTNVSWNQIRKELK